MADFDEPVLHVEISEVSHWQAPSSLTTARGFLFPSGRPLLSHLLSLLSHGHHCDPSSARLPAPSPSTTGSTDYTFSRSPNSWK